MFSYYGSKSKIIDYYPPPKYGKIIEPFAGSARYSLKYWNRDITLVDKYDVIIDVWKYLQQASKSDLLNLPHLKKGDSIKNYNNLSKEEKKFLGFLVCAGVESPRQNVASFNGVNVLRDLKRISNQLHKIKHWNIKKGCYTDIENQKATYYIDPPYQFGGEHYKESNKNIDYEKLSQWCKSRNGQVIVCENTKADWMDFSSMVDMKGSMFKTTEAIWTNYPTSYNNNQLSIFDNLKYES